MRTFSVAVLLLSALLYQKGRFYRNVLFPEPRLPTGYFYGGSVDDHCHTYDVEDLAYCEDATLWRLLDDTGALKEQKAIISCDKGRKQWNTVMGPLKTPGPRGTLWVSTPSSDKEVARPQKIDLQGYPEGHDFHPLGIAVYPSYGGNSSNLYAVNHAGGSSVIEQFSISTENPTVATWVRTISSPYFVAPNALSLTSSHSFYLSNDHLFTRRLPSLLGEVLPLAESLLGLPLGWVAHVTLDASPSASEPVLSHSFAKLGIPFPNGVTLSPDGNTLAISSTTEGAVQFYTRNATDNTLSARKTVYLPFTPDNAEYDEHGRLIVAGHPSFLALSKLAKGKAEVAPSWVTAITPRRATEGGGGDAALSEEFDIGAPLSVSAKVPPSKDFEVTTLFQSNGTGFSASTTGLFDTLTESFYVTGLYANEGVIVCNAKN